MAIPQRGARDDDHASRHSETRIRLSAAWLATDDPQAEGWLFKQSTWRKEWRKRFFTLKHEHLFFAKSESERPHGDIDLGKALAVCLLYTSPSPRDRTRSRMPSSA